MKPAPVLFIAVGLFWVLQIAAGVRSCQGLPGQDHHRCIEGWAAHPEPNSAGIWSITVHATLRRAGMDGCSQGVQREHQDVGEQADSQVAGPHGPVIVAECMGGAAISVDGRSLPALVLASDDDGTPSTCLHHQEVHLLCMEPSQLESIPSLTDLCPSGIVVAPAEFSGVAFNATLASSLPAAVVTANLGRAGGSAVVSRPDISMTGSSLLQTATHARSSAQATMIPGLMDILEIAMKLLMPPVMDPFMEKMNDHFSNTESQELAGDIDAATPVDTATKSEPQLRTNIAALLPDAVAMATRELAPAAIATRVATEAYQRIASDVAPRAVPKMHDQLLGAIPDRLAGTLSSLLERELAVSLVPMLSISLPRAVVPAVTAAMRLTGRPIGTLGQPSDLEPWCARCYQSANGTQLRPGDEHTMPWAHCTVCTPSYRLALAHYYGTYYSQYYSLYYMRYYGVKAMLAIEEVQHSPLDKAHVKEAREQNEFGRSSGPSERPITAFGQHQPMR